MSLAPDGSSGHTPDNFGVAERAVGWDEKHGFEHMLLAAD